MSNVSRSTYQKVCEENKRLMKDIKILVGRTNSLTPQKIELLETYRAKFKDKDDLDYVIKLAAIEYLKDHPEYDITSPKFIRPIKEKVK